jgi:hypothetical protein
MSLLSLKKAQWYINRLRAMSLAEICHRCEEWFLVEQERFLMRHRPGFGFRFSDQMGDALSCFQKESDIQFFFSWCGQEKTAKLYQSLFLVERDAALQEAEALLCHTTTLLGRRFEGEDKINWSQDPVTEREWPRLFWADIDIRDGQTIGGVKWVWELNRHHHLVTLGKAYYLSGDERYAEEACAQLASWIHTNPARIGVNWTSPLELAIRLINWVWVLAFLRCSPAITPELFTVILRSIVEQTLHISRHLAAHSSANNHLIGEAAGLAVVGLAFPWLRHAERWRDKGLKILTRELARQIYPDGVPAEQAIHYLAFVLDFNLLVWRLAELNGLAVPKIWHERLGAACDFIRHMMDEEGNVPAIGDSDDAWVVRLDDRLEANNYRSILATAAVLLKRPEFKVSAGQWDEKSHWLLGEQGKRIYDSLPTDIPQVTSRAFRQGGYCVMRAHGRVIVFDCGPLGYLSTAVHGHADALSITVNLEGQAILIDPNTYAYQEGYKWRDYFRSTRAHSTVVVNGQNQSEIWGAFLWGRKACTQLLHWESTPEYDLAIAEQNGYKKLGVVHRRTVLFHKPDWIIVVDRLLGQGQRSFEQLWHLPADCHVDTGPGHTKVSVGDAQFAIIPLEMPGAQSKVRKGEKQPIQGWVSPHYGQIEPAPVISFSGQSRLPARLVTGLYLAFTSEIASLSELAVRVLDSLDNLEKEVNV